MLQAVSRLLGTVLIAAAAASPARADFQAGAEAYSRGDYRAAIDQWVPYAESGDPRAMYNLGQMYRLGIGTEKDLGKAEDYYRRAAALGHIGAQANLGSLLFDRKPPQVGEALIFWRQAATGGDPKAQFLTGVQYFNGDYVTRDHVQAYAWLSLSAKGGVREAAQALATVKGYMEPADVEAATKLAATLVIPPPETAAKPPTMQAVLPADIEAQLDGAVLRHPVDDAEMAGLSAISPDAVAGALPLPSFELSASKLPAPGPAPAAAVKPAPVAEVRDAEHRVQFASFRTEAEALALRETLLDRYRKALGGAGVEIDQVLSPSPQGVAYRVRSAPLKGGEAAANNICRKLEAENIPCQPAKTVKVPVNVRAKPAAAANLSPANPLPAMPAATNAPPTSAAAVPVAGKPSAGADESAPAATPQADGEAAAPATDEPGPRAAYPGDKWRVQVGAGRTEEEARFRWSRLMGANADLLDAAELYIYKVDLGQRGVFYRVQIGGFATRPEAVGLCERLRTRKVECFVAATKQ